jgi:catechol 2,3-dioxygenase-like lactoylglutathione lyase family enzyme
MSTMLATTENATQAPRAAAIDTKLEAVILPVSDVERAKRFYAKLGWRLDADFTNGDDWHVVQFTPPGSPASVLFGKGFTSAVPGSVQGNFLVVDDIAVAREQLAARGVEASEVFHFDQSQIRVTGSKGRQPGPDPKGGSYFSFVTFSDPDGNSWLVQEVKTRFPGRGFSSDVPALTELLREAEAHHGQYEPTAPKHHWSSWYAGYVVARQRGKTPEEAVREASIHTEATGH